MFDSHSESKAEHTESGVAVAISLSADGELSEAQARVIALDFVARTVKQAGTDWRLKDAEKVTRFLLTGDVPDPR